MECHQVGHSTRWKELNKVLECSACHNQCCNQKEGWKYGETRNDELKTHPGLVPYEELPDSEREYDRQTAIQTLKLIMKLGFDIQKK